MLYYDIVCRFRTIGTMNCMTRLTKLPFEHSVAAGANDGLDDPEDCTHDHSIVRSDNSPMKRTMREHPECSNQKSIPERPFPQKTTDNQYSQGLIIRLPQEKVSNRITKHGKLLSDLYSPQSYLIPSSRCTYYLRIEEISVLGQTHILFKQKLDKRIRKRKKKAIVRNIKLYLPIPSAFKGIIKADQLKIIPSKTSIIKLYYIANSGIRSPKTVGVYNGKINEIAKKSR